MKTLLQARLLPALLAGLLLVTGCDLLGGDDEAPLRTSNVVVLNQGNFGDGNGSVTLYNPSAKTAVVDALTGFGSILQSAGVVDGRLFVLANTGARIDVFETETFTQTAQVSDLVSPRYLAVAGDKAYVTNLFGAAGSYTGGKVSVIDLNGPAMTREVAVGDNPEGVTVAAGRVYVANNAFGAGNTLTVIDAATDAVAETITLDCDGPRMLLTDAQDEVWVVCTGRQIYNDDYSEVVDESYGKVLVLDGATGAVVQTFALDGRVTTQGPGQDAFYDPVDEEVYVVRGSDTILRFDAATNTAAGVIGPLPAADIGAVAYDGTQDVLYVGHVPSYTEGGTVSLHTRDGAETTRFPAGVAPTYITFLR